jgi:zinc/manganese transport system substrate-binding protein
MVLSRSRTAALLAAGAALAACGGDAATNAADDGPYLVATTGIWADIAGLVACDGAIAVRTLVPAGGDAHSYEPSLRDREALDGATLVVANGLGLEELLDDTLDDVAADGVPVVRMAEHVPGHLAGGEHTHGDDPSDDHGHDGDDPHVWFDPTRIAAALPALADALVAAGADQVAVDGCVETATRALTELDATVAETLAAVPEPRRVLVTNHDSLGYFADRYDFTVLGTVLPSTSTLSEAGPADLEQLGQAIEAAGVPAIFTETLHRGGDAEALAARLGVDVVELHTDSLGEAGSGAETYARLLTADAAAIAAALGDG